MRGPKKRAQNKVNDCKIMVPEVRNGTKKVYAAAHP